MIDKVITIGLIASLCLCLGCSWGSNCGAAYFENMNRIPDDGSYAVQLADEATPIIALQSAKQVQVTIDRGASGSVTMKYVVDGKEYVDTFAFE